MTEGVFTVVVSGLPASGKTTVARQIGPLLGVPVIDKDDLLEASFDEVGDISPAERDRLSREADADLRRRVERDPRAVVVSHWRRPELSLTSGTPIGWMHRFSALVEVYCLCDPKTATGRFRARARHPAHGDRGKSSAEVLDQFQALHRLGPLGFGPVVTVNAEIPVDAIQLAEQIRRAV